MEQNHELPSSFQQTERCFYVCCSGCGRIAFRHRYSPNTLFRAYFPFYQYDAKLLTAQLDRGGLRWLSMYRNQSLHTWRLKRRRTRTRFPVASQKTVLSTMRGEIIAVVTRFANGNERDTRNTDTSCKRSTLKRMETRGPCVPGSPGSFPGVLLN